VDHQPVVGAKEDNISHHQRIGWFYLQVDALLIIEMVMVP
jgi:hypothetical protein